MPERSERWGAHVGAPMSPGAGAVEPKLKEFAYLKTSLVNGCEY